MPFETVEFPSDVVDRAGDALIGFADAAEWFADQPFSHLEVIDNWRAAHAWPLNTFQMALRTRAGLIDSNALVAQRRKRLKSIRGKLDVRRDLHLTDIQDIAGCRAIVSSIDQLHDLISVYKDGYAKHTFIERNDYVKEPKSRDGYRSYHFIYRYHEGDSRWGGLKVEIQMRTGLMHCWATAVETVDFFLKEGLKQHKGSPEWQRFFQLMSSVIALKEGCRPMRKTPRTDKELVLELRELDAALRGVARRLRAYGETLAVATSPSARESNLHYVVLSLDGTTPEPTLSWYGFRKREAADADRRITSEEAHGKDAVLVSVSDSSRLQQAFPNYYLDTSTFCDLLENYIQ